MIKIWGRETSINVQKVMWTAHEIGLEVERIDVGGPHGGLDTPEFGKLNPNRKIPVMEDGDLVLWESNSIVRHLARVHDTGGLWPTDEAELALADQWMDWQVSSLWNSLRIVFLGQIRTAPEDRDEAAIAAASQQSSAFMRMLDGHLGSRDFLTGAQFSIGDIPVGATCYRYMNLEIARPDLRHVEAWYERLQTRAAYRDHVMYPMS
jgi:glutathione S-transferase